MAKGKIVNFSKKELVDRLFVRSTFRDSFHVAGVIPIAGMQSDLQYPIPDYLLPAGKNITMIDRSILECVYAGCNTIWIIANDDMKPILRYHLGDCVQDLQWHQKNEDLGKFRNAMKQWIPIYYINVNPRVLNQVNNCGFNILMGIPMIKNIAHRVSNHAAPRKYYITFPQGLCAPGIFKMIRKYLRRDTPYYTRFEGKTFLDGLPLSFSMSDYNVVDWREGLRKRIIREAYQEGEGKPKLSNIKDWPVHKILNHQMKLHNNFFDLRAFYDASKFEGYRDYLLDYNLPSFKDNVVYRLGREVTPIAFYEKAEVIEHRSAEIEIEQGEEW